jgi:hypothetical protein
MLQIRLKVRKNKFSKAKIRKIMTNTSLIIKKILLPFEGVMEHTKNIELLKKIALVIKKLREEKGVTQDEVYNETKIHVGRIETAKGNVTVSTLAILCSYFRIKISEFHRMVEEMK